VYASALESVMLFLFHWILAEECKEAVGSFKFDMRAISNQSSRWAVPWKEGWQV